ncbi:hypothetical protein KM043_009945 [Ampulex compressa]|nr:hypothetical protein KM043_009945 [Ampulex compressa]
MSAIGDTSFHLVPSTLLSTTRRGSFPRFLVYKSILSLVLYPLQLSIQQQPLEALRKLQPSNSSLEALSRGKSAPHRGGWVQELSKLVRHHPYHPARVAAPQVFPGSISSQSRAHTRKA